MEFDAAHHPRAVDGHPVLAVEPRRLQGRASTRPPTYGRAFPMMMTAAGTVSAAARLRHGCRRRRPPGDRDRSPPGRAGQRDRRPLGDQGADPVARRQADLRRECRGHRGRGLAAATRPKCRTNIRRRQAELVSGHIAKQDIVITTALIPGQAGAAPDQRCAARDDAAGQRGRRPRGRCGGNVEGCVAGENVVKHGVTIIGASNLPGRWPPTPRRLFARNLFNFLSAFWDKEQNRPVLPDDDEIVKAIRLTQGGKVVNERLTAGQLNSSDILVIGGGIAGLSAASALCEACQGHRPRGRARRRLSLVRPQRDDAALRARRSARPRVELSPAAASSKRRRRISPTFRSATGCRCSSMPAPTSLPPSIELDAAIAPFAQMERVDEAGIIELCPVIRTGDRRRDRGAGRPQRHPARHPCAAAGPRPRHSPQRRRNRQRRAC